MSHLTSTDFWGVDCRMQMGNVSLVDHRWWPTENHCQDWPFLSSQDSWIFLCKEKLHLILSLQKIKIPIFTWHRIRNLSFWLAVDLIGHKYSPKRVSKNNETGRMSHLTSIDFGFTFGWVDCRFALRPASHMPLWRTKGLQGVGWPLISRVTAESLACPQI